MVHNIVDLSTLFALHGVMTNLSDSDGRFSAGFKSYITFRLSKVQNRLNAQAAQILREHSDLALTEWRILSHLCSVESDSAAHMCRDLVMDKGQVSRNVKKLIAKHYVTSDASRDDQRQAELRATEKGRAAQGRMAEIMRRRQKQLTQDLSDDELLTFYAVLEKVGMRAEERVL